MYYILNKFDEPCCVNRIWVLKILKENIDINNIHTMNIIQKKISMYITELISKQIQWNWNSSVECLNLNAISPSPKKK